ncbi:hypothetical protein [Roseovarius sp.]|uniref:hypothetical protein n=1 Tax=Roseovarius sp. TaxID=1486281 RepID=UPI003D10D466
MFEITLSNPSRPSLAQRLRHWIRSVRNPDPADPVMLADLERLADISPHLLADLGFEDIRTGPSGITSWRRGRLRVVRHTGPDARHHAFRVPCG